MKISAEAATSNLNLINALKTKWAQEEKKMEDRTYFKYISRTAEVFPDIDLTARALLDAIALCNVEALTVTEAMDMYHLASPATLHRKLNDLMMFGYIEHRYEGTNRRTKYLHPTQKSLDIYKELGKAMKEAVND
jgi:DNA-binding MarR family transcriptional regulator